MSDQPVQKKTYWNIVWPIGLALQLIIPYGGVHLIGNWEYTLAVSGTAANSQPHILGIELNGYLTWFKLAALVGNIILCFFFYFALVQKRASFVTRGFGVAILLLMLSVLCFLVALFTLNHHALNVHFIAVILGAFCYATLDLCLAVSVSKNDPSLYTESRAEYVKFFVLLDVPNIVSFSIIGLLLLDPQSILRDYSDRTMGMYFFVSGVIAFQWLSSNLLFVMLMMHGGSDGFCQLVRGVCRAVTSWLERQAGLRDTKQLDVR